MRLADRPVEVRAADRLSVAELTAVFNAGFSDYAVALQLDDADFRDHVHSNDIDLTWSRVAVDACPVALALIAHRGAEAWVGGMGTVPDHRRRGIGERVLVDGLAAARRHGCQTVWLEVLADNERAIRLYEKLGFTTERMLIAWSCDPLSAATGGGRPRAVELAVARAWIAGHRRDREPWQRADASLDRMAEGGAELHAQILEREEKTVAAVVFRRGTDVLVLQLAAADVEAAIAVLAAIAEERPLRFSNLPSDSLLTPALEGLGAQILVRQLEMRLALA